MDPNVGDSRGCEWLGGREGGSGEEKGLLRSRGRRPGTGSRCQGAACGGRGCGARRRGPGTRGGGWVRVRGFGGGGARTRFPGLGLSESSVAPSRVEPRPWPASRPPTVRF